MAAASMAAWRRQHGSGSIGGECGGENKRNGDKAYQQ